MPRKYTKVNKKTLKREKKSSAVKYISRAKAIRKLNLTMNQFRHVCILKGVYPRLPTKMPKGMNLRKIYYHLDDIKPLVHDKVVKKIRDLSSFKKHIVRLEARKEFKTKEQVMKTRPSISLVSTIQERYPTFQDALLELGDCLSMIYMFASYKVSNGDRVNKVNLARRIAMEWDSYVKQTGCLKKCFISVKGYYYTVVVCGIPVTWMVPHQFSVEYNQTVNFNVMYEFLEFYVVLMKYVNFKLYTQAGLKYPPKIDSKDGVEYMGKLVLERLAEKIPTSAKEIDTKEAVDVNKLQEIAESTTVDGKEDNIATDKPEVEGQNKDGAIESNVISAEATVSGIFTGLVFYLQREVSKKSVGFVIESCGGRIVNDVNDKNITHQIGERGEHKSIEREYVQPQWVFDCVNENFVLPCGEYTIGQKLPPHLSPYINEGENGYESERRKQLDAIKENKQMVEEKEESAEEEDSLETDFVNGLAEEQGEKVEKKAKVPKSAIDKKIQSAERQRKMSVMSSKDRRIVRKNEQIQRSKNRKVQQYKDKLAKSKENKD